jgi:signal transduction histidine kinase/CheY-like chemotaxis protein
MVDTQADRDRVQLGAIIRQDMPQLMVVFLSFALMALVSCLFVRTIIEKEIFSNVQENIHTAEAVIRSDLREAEVALLYAELLVRTALELGQSPDQIRRQLALQSEMLRPAESRVPGFMNLYAYVNGTFIPDAQWTPSADWAPERRVWYAAAAEADNAIVFTTPYTDDRSGSVIITLVKKIRPGPNGTYDLVALDMDFSVIAGYIIGLHYAKGSYGMLIDEHFRFIAHPNSDYLGRPMAEINQWFYRVAEGLGDEKRSRSSMQIQMTNSQGVRVVSVFKRLYNNWVLGIATPVTSYYRDANSMFIALFILGTVSMSILSAFLIRLSILKDRSDQQSRGKTSFLARMSHEIRTPMNSILGMAEIIQRKPISAEVQEYMNILHHSGQNLLAIINDILDFSRIESNRFKIEKQKYHIASVLNDTVNMIRPRAAEKSLDFLVNLDSAIPAELTGDEGRLRQILTNLLSNAVKYTREGFVSLDVGLEERSAQTVKLFFAVRDSGVGIKPEDLGRLFTDFTRLDARTNQGIEGPGLGLVIARGLCRAMGGDITVTSEYGSGTVFRATVVQDFENSLPAAQVSGAESKRVLFFDWRERYLKSVGGAFINLGITVDCPVELEQFKTALEKGDYDYAFVSSRYALDCIYTLGKRKRPLRLVLLMELGEISVFRDVSSVLMPVYSVPLAHIIDENQNSAAGPGRGAQLKIRFSAPEARILIVDDISTNLRVAKELMRPYNINIHTCLSGAEAVELVKENRYDLIFMDHMMPGMDGIETTARIRAWEAALNPPARANGAPPEHSGIPIVALTANAVSGQREIFLQSGINDFLAKPIDIQKLDDILEKWLPREKQIAAPGAEEEIKEEEVKPELIETAPLEADIAIAGMDIEKGIRNLGGSPEVYFDILADFSRDVESRSAKIRDALERGDIKLYGTLVHALKGAALSIGALETGELAADLERAAFRPEGSGDTERLAAGTTELLKKLGVLADDIRNATARRERADVRERSDYSALNLEALQTALETMDIAVVNSILREYAGLSLDGETRSKIAEVEQHILMFEYDKAIEKIQNLF